MRSENQLRVFQSGPYISVLSSLRFIACKPIWSQRKSVLGLSSGRQNGFYLRVDKAVNVIKHFGLTF